MNPPLRSEQIAETLRRHGLPDDTEVLGISYERDPSRPARAERVTVNIADKRLVVPDDVLAMPGPPAGEPRRRTLFSRPD